MSQMLSGQLYDNFKAMPQQQKDYAIAWFFGSIGMRFEGFTDSKSWPDFPFSKFAIEEFGNAMLMAETNCDPSRRHCRVIQ
jgi:hypothetical protein